MFKRILGRGSSSKPPQASRSKRKNYSIPEVNESLSRFHKPEGVPKLQILFFHGLQTGDSSDAYLETWRSEDCSCFWPQTWLAKEFPHAHMFSVSYDGHVGKSSQGISDMYIIAENLLFDLIKADIGQIPNCPLILVGHCFGGLVIKQLCLRAIYMVGLSRFQCERAKLKALVKSLKGMFFYGTPHHGNPCIDKLEKINESPLLKYFTTLSREASRLNSEFDQLHKVYPLWRIGGLGENLQTKSGLFRDFVAAPEESSRLGDQFNVFPVDHFSVCKPRNTTDRRLYALTHLLHNIASDLETTHECMGLPEYPIELQRRAHDIIETLADGHVLGIYGMGGIGKTTLAKEVFNTVSKEFEYTCFVDHVKGIHISELKDRLLVDFHCGGSRVKVMDWSQLKEKNTLIVMDDVDREDQLNILPKLGHFGNNSR